MKLLLKGNKTYQWKNKGNIFFLGYFFDDDGFIYHNEEAVNFIDEYLKTGNIESLCRKISGSFSIIIKEEKSCQIASDAMNFFPVFYTEINDEYLISDYFETLVQERKKFNFNENALPEFETAGFVLGNETLDQYIFKTNANQLLTLNKLDGKVTQYRDFITDSFSKDSYQKLSKELEEKLMNVGNRMIKFLNSRTAVVPLSGGFDSRLIVSLLKKGNYEKVICFTYGEINPEVAISKSVAEKFGYEWHFVNFAEIDIEKIQQQKQYTEYLEFAANGFAMPYLMEYFAVTELMRENKIPKDSVFLPGHSGDFLGGSYILKTVKNNLKIKELPSFIESKYFVFIKKSRSMKMQIRKRIKQNLSAKIHHHNGYSLTVEQWDIQEKLAKFIFHSTQVFNFWGFEHYFPLWDKELVNFYRKVPFEFREGKKMYDEVLEEKFFAPQNISFGRNELKNSQLKIFFQKLKDSVRYFFPWKMVLKKVNNADWPYYRMLTKNMLPLVEKDGKTFKNFKTYNAVICSWYPKYLKNKFGNTDNFK